MVCECGTRALDFHAVLLSVYSPEACRLPAVSPHSYGAAAPPARSSARPAIAAAAAAALLGLLALALLSAGAQGGEDASALEQTAAQRQEVRDLLDQVMKEQGNVACAERGI
jgi:hypothetical protein